MLWLIEHARELLIKHLAGHGGRAAFDRLFGKAATTVTSSVNRCSSVFGRTTWAVASAPGGAPGCGWGAVGARPVA
eukprot:2662942-Alexandrium_andersonii.AAC.1